MLINLRNALMTGKRLPYARAVEYIEGTGTQWIDTGVVYSDTLKFAITYEHNMGGGTYQSLCGVRVTTGPNEGRGYFSAEFRSWSSFSFRTVKGSGSAGFSNASAFNAKRTIAADKNEATIYDADGNIVETKDMSSVGVMPTAYSILTFPLFGCTTWNGYNLGHSYNAICKIYAATLYDGDAPVRDFFPVIDKQGVACLYDKISGLLFYNVGTGDFLTNENAA